MSKSASVWKRKRQYLTKARVRRRQQQDRDRIAQSKGYPHWDAWMKALAIEIFNRACQEAFQKMITTHLRW